MFDRTPFVAYRPIAPVQANTTYSNTN